MKKLTVQDATKDELIQYFFSPEGLGEYGGGFRIGASQDRFLLWLQKKRSGEYLDSADASLDASQKALHEYLDCVRKMNDATSIDEKLEWAEKGNKAYESYEKANKAYDKFSKKADEVWK